MTAKKKKSASTGDDSFEALYGRLEEVTQRLGDGDLTLEQSVALYEEGMQLAQRCQELLTGVEQRIETLRQAFEDQSPGGDEQGP